MTASTDRTRGRRQIEHSFDRADTPHPPYSNIGTPSYGRVHIKSGSHFWLGVRIFIAKFFLKFGFGCWVWVALVSRLSTPWAARGKKRAEGIPVGCGGDGAVIGACSMSDATFTVERSVRYVGDGLGGIWRLNASDEEDRQEDAFVARKNVVADRLISVVDRVEEVGDLAVVEAHHLDVGHGLGKVAGLDVPPKGLELVSDHVVFPSVVDDLTVSGSDHA